MIELKFEKLIAKQDIEGFTAGDTLYFCLTFYNKRIYLSLDGEPVDYDLIPLNLLEHLEYIEVLDQNTFDLSTENSEDSS